MMSMMMPSNRFRLQQLHSMASTVVVKNFAVLLFHVLSSELNIPLYFLLSTTDDAIAPLFIMAQDFAFSPRCKYLDVTLLDR